MPDSQALLRVGSRVRLSDAVTWVGAAIVIGVAAAVGWLGWYEYREAFETEGNRAELMARLNEDHATRSVEITSIVLTSIAEQLAAQPAGDATPISPALGHALLGLPFLRSIAVLDRQGSVLASTSAEETGRMVDLRPLGKWPAVGGDRLGGFVPGRALGDFASGTRAVPVPRGVGFIPLTRQVTMRSGEGLLLVALINPDALSNQQTMTADDALTGAVLADYGGTVLAATPSMPVEPGAHLTGHPVFSEHLARSEHLSYIGAGVGTEEQVGAYRLSRTRALVSIVEYPAGAVRTHWWHAMQPLFGVGVLSVFFLAAMTVTARRSLLNRERTERLLDEQRVAVIQRERAFQQQVETQLAVTALMLEISPLPLWVLDSTGRIASVNQAWEEFTGRRRANVVGTEESLHMPMDASPGALEAQHVMLSQGRRATCEVRITHGDGSQRDVVLIRVAMPADEGAPGVLCVLMDVSEFRDAERATQDARALAEASSRAKSEFIANISHELRTPLQSILGFSELGMVRGRDQPRLAAMFTDVHAAGERMLALVNDLLDVSKIESSVGPFRMAREDLGTCVNEVAHELAPLLAAKRLELELQLPDRRLWGQVDSQRMQQVLRNVIANAIKFSPAGSRIAVHGDVNAEQRICLSVSDQGPGIPPDELERIFEPFVQSSQTQDGSGGTGLGLAICRRILAVHGGTIHAENRVAGGASFLIELPGLQEEDRTDTVRMA